MSRRYNSAKIKQAFASNELLKRLNFCRSSIQSKQFFFLNPFHLLPLKYCLPHVTGRYTCYKSVQSIRVFTPSLCQRRDVTDTVQDTSRACQSGNVFMRKVQISSTITVALVAFCCMGFNVHVFLNLV